MLQWAVVVAVCKDVDVNVAVGAFAVPLAFYDGLLWFMCPDVRHL